MSTRASAGTTDSPSSFGWERGWFAIRSWRSLSMLAIESRFLPYTGVVIGRQRAGYLSLSSSWLREGGGRWMVIRAEGIQGGRWTRPLCSIDARLPNKVRESHHVRLRASVRRLTAFRPPNSLAISVQDFGRGAPGAVPGSKFGSISG